MAGQAILDVLREGGKLYKQGVDAYCSSPEAVVLGGGVGTGAYYFYKAKKNWSTSAQGVGAGAWLFGLYCYYRGYLEEKNKRQSPP